MSNSSSMLNYSRPGDAALDIRPITPAIGAEIHDVRLSGDVPAKTMTAIRDALLRHPFAALLSASTAPAS
jgi:alpha-ketoglutarate-dependent taurine dioxygenase